MLTGRCSAPTYVIALENTLNGIIFPQEEIAKISDFAGNQGIRMHLDGARLWHVAAETGTSMKELCDPFDSVSLCFSKGLGEDSGASEDAPFMTPYRCPRGILHRRNKRFRRASTVVP